MNMVFSEAEFAELKTKTFQVPERLNAGVDMAFFFENFGIYYEWETSLSPSCFVCQSLAFYSYRYLHFPYKVFSAGLTLMLQTTQYSQSQLCKLEKND
jgi:hypothetical protein